VRSGEYERAEAFSSECQLGEFEDVDLFVGKVKPVLDSLDHGDCKEVVKWMHQNSSKLKKLDSNVVSKFELELRLQEFVAMIQSGNSSQAIKYAQDTFLPYTEMGEAFAARVKHAMGCLVFLGLKDSPLSQEFTGKDRWEFLKGEFLKLFYSLYGLTQEPLLEISVVAGLHALLTPTCQRAACGMLPDATNAHQPLECPACSQDVREAILQVPLPIRSTSSLVCPITRAPIDESNYPMALPNGQVYSKKAIDQGTSMDHSTFTDPRSGETFDVTSIRRVYIM